MLAESEPSEVLEPKHKAYLVPQTEDGDLDPVPLDLPLLAIGRNNGIGCHISDPKVSRRHARILAVHNHYYVQDLGSTNGTFINRDRVTHEHMADGDLIGFGNTLFRFEMSTDLDEQYLGKLTLEAITSLAEAVDHKDAYTRGHSEAVGRVAQRLALELGFSPAAAERVGIAGRLHDIGKVGVPNAVLGKEGPLDSAELALIHKHPVESKAILAPLKFLADILPMVRQHHERFDGRGYPDGLSGQAIAVEACIVQAADCYHAMASQRPYRKPLHQEFIRQELVKGAGAQFHPEVTQAFLKILPSLPGVLATTA